MDNLTLEEAQALYDNNSEGLKISFSSYYKYTFNFFGENEVVHLYASYGADSSDIYRFDVTPDPIDAPKTLAEVMNVYYSGSVEDKSTGRSFEWYNL